MNHTRPTAPNVLNLRRTAEKKVASRPGFSDAIIRELDAKRLYHELQVYQIELEMQHAELQQSHQTLDLLQEQYAALYDFAPLCYMSLDQRGTILKCNLASAELVGGARAQIVKRSFERLVAEEDRPAFIRLLEQAFGRRTLKATCELRLFAGEPAGVPVHLEAQVGETGQECLLAITVATDGTPEDRDRPLPACRQSGAGACRAASPPVPGKAAPCSIASLSRRERQTLKLVVEGHTNSAIAAAMNISPKSVETYRSRLMLKLGINTVPGLVKYALLHDIISL